jgi:cell division protein FtsW
MATRRATATAPLTGAPTVHRLGTGWESTALVTLTLLLLSFGLVTLYSASSFLALQNDLPDYYYVIRQAAGAAMGLLVLVACAKLPHRWWEWAAWPMVGVTLLMLLLLVIPGTEAIAPERNGARRWLTVGVSIQPSEIAKMAVIVWTAMLAVRKQSQLRSLSKGLVPFLMVWGAMALLIVLEPDLSTACVLLAVGSLTVFAAGGRIGHFVFLGALSLPLLLSQMQVGFRAQRWLAFLDPSSDPAGAGFQVRQSLIALGSGGVTGQGFGEGRQRFGFLPEAHNDFIFAMVGEEWGLIGVLLLLSLYIGIVLVGFRIARRAPDLFGQLLAVGITNLIAIQAMLHMAVGLSLVPPTGLALPLVSYGRSNLIVTLAGLGILLAIARAADEAQVGRRRRA